MSHAETIEETVSQILRQFTAWPKIVNRAGGELSVEEKHCLVLEPEFYRIESPGLDRLHSCLAGLGTADAHDAFWQLLGRRIQHPIVPWFLIQQGRMLHLLEWILDGLDRAPLDQSLILMATDAFKLGHGAYSVEELETIGNVLGTLLTRSQMEMGQHSISAVQRENDALGPGIMQAMRAKRDVYKALGTLQEVVRGAMYRKMERMLRDN